MNTLTLIGRAATLVRLALDDRLPPGMGDDMREISVAMRDYHDASRALVTELTGALTRLANASATVGNLDHAGVPVPSSAWAEMYAANNAARAALAKVKGSAP